VPVPLIDSRAGTDQRNDNGRLRSMAYATGLLVNIAIFVLPVFA
jgi:hypothetical protein